LGDRGYAAGKQKLAGSLAGLAFRDMLTVGAGGPVPPGDNGHPDRAEQLILMRCCLEAT